MKVNHLEFRVRVKVKPAYPHLQLLQGPLGTTLERLIHNAVSDVLKDPRSPAIASVVIEDVSTKHDSPPDEAAQ